MNPKKELLRSLWVNPKPCGLGHFSPCPLPQQVSAPETAAARGSAVLTVRITVRSVLGSIRALRF